ncbi:hypothetical protein LX32DRAFT_603558, partial [Colletotrichum zoysiae]
RLRKLYPMFNILAAAFGGSALSLLTNEARVSVSALDHLVAYLLATSAVMATFTVIITTMLSFKFDSDRKPTAMDSSMAWVPVVLADCGVLAFVCGFVLWFVARHNWLCGALIGLQLEVLLLMTAKTAFWMWDTVEEDANVFKEPNFTVKAQDGC